MLSERMKSLPPGGTTSVNQLVIADLNQLDTAVLRGDLRSTSGFSTLIFPISNLVTVRGISSISCKDSPRVVSKLLPTRIVSISSISTSCTKFNSVPSSTFIFISIVPMSKVTSPQSLSIPTSTTTSFPSLSTMHGTCSAVATILQSPSLPTSTIISFPSLSKTQGTCSIFGIISTVTSPLVTSILGLSNTSITSESRRSFSVDPLRSVSTLSNSEFTSLRTPTV